MIENYNIADAEWEWYIGELYSKLIENVCKNTLKTVVEIAPGFRYKIAYALKNINFAGDLYIIDTSEDVIEYIKNKYKEILPNANIICINKKFGESVSDVPNKIDLLLANHCIDDLIISEYIDSTYNDNLIAKDFKEILIDAWKKLKQDEEKVMEITSNVYLTFKNFFEAKQINMIMMGQYKSNLYFKDELEEMNKITENCFEQIKELINTDDEYVNKILEFYPFGDDERYMGKELLDNTQNAKNWIVGKKK
jgi:hypothetical protein